MRQWWMAALVVAAGCRPARSMECVDCGAITIVAIREPASVFPPLVGETVGRDIGDRIYQRLAVLRPGGATVDPAAFRPDLATRWERVDSLTWRFHLAKAVWHDGRPVTAGDVVFSFGAFTDTALVGSVAGLDGVWASSENDSTVLVHFAAYSPEQLFDATWLVRILPRHVWDALPAAEWAHDTSLARLVGSGPYRVEEWRRGQSLVLRADTTRVRAPHPTKLVWRFVPDPDQALNLMLAGQGDLLEHAGGPAATERARSDTSLRLLPYPSAVYGFAAFRFQARSGRPSPFADRRVRQALTAAVDRTALAHAILGPGTRVPAGPVSRLAWIAPDEVPVAAQDSALADKLLDAAGWKRDGNGVRSRRGVLLSFGILVPGTSAGRRLAAEVLQESWRRHGVVAHVDVVDFPIFQQRLQEGAFDVYVGAYLDEPSLRGLLDQWSRAGFGALNYGHYANPHVDSLMHLALRTPQPPLARSSWRQVLDSLEADPPAIFLYAPLQVAVISNRLDGVTINPWSWLDGVEGWVVTQ